MKRTRPHLWAILYSAALVLFTVYLLLDAFVIPRSYSAVSDGDVQTGSGIAAGAAVTDTSYDDGSISITITQYREHDTDIYVADITLSDISALKTAFANDTFGKNLKETTSAMADRNGAILAINGDYYGARSGYVIRNGVLYRSAVQSADQQDLVIGADGEFSVVTEGSVSAEALLEQGAWQVLSFGPGLLNNGEITVGETTEVDKARASNPRTAVGQLGSLHYVFVTADGRTDRSAGLSLYQLAEFMQSLGVKTAYNLDGGGSTTMVFCGSVVNIPTDGNNIEERRVSDIVYIG